MNFKENESAAKLRGGYYTAPEIASFLLKWVLKKNPRTLVEPSCGDGVFFRSLNKLTHESLNAIMAFEIEPAEAEKARNSARPLNGSSFAFLTKE